MKVKVLDTKGNTVEEITLKKEVFGIEPNLEILGQYLRVFKANLRQGTSSTKTRGDVSGGGIKPWRQKGTGRARVGSSRVPLWRHGGISHGPQPHDWSLRFPKKMKRLAIISALSSIAADKKITVLDKISMKTPDTKAMAEILKKIDVAGKILIVLNNPESNTIKSAKNIKGVKTTVTTNLNAYELLNAKNVVFLKDAVESLEKKYASK
jgi:large subunit ribosomal protein L4